jgi:F0F1-type ATP synthase epsilon subunit
MGEITVLDKHEPLISVLSAGIIKIIDKDKQEQFFPITSGFLEIKPDNEVRVIIEE